MSQLSYTEEMDVAFPGMLYDISFADIVSGVSQESSVSIAFGSGVVRGTIDDGVKIPAAEADIVRGVVVHSHAYEMDVTADDDGIRPKAMVNVLRRGRIWVKVVTAVTAGDRAYLFFAGANPKGSWGNAMVADETMDTSLQAEFVTSAADDGLAVIDVNFVNF